MIKNDITFKNLEKTIIKFRQEHKPIKCIKMCNTTVNLLKESLSYRENASNHNKYYDLSFWSIEIKIDDNMIGWKIEY